MDIRTEREGRYTELDPERLRATLAKLLERIVERFPGSGLSKVASDLIGEASRVFHLVQGLQVPLW
jgi:hypothetical protein